MNLSEHPDRDELRALFLARLEFGLNPILVPPEEEVRGG
jgi:hypothetical protein